MSANIFILGLDKDNLRLLEGLKASEPCEFHPLLKYEDIRSRLEFPVMDMLDKARRRLDEFEGSVDAVCAYWDFPATTMAPILRRERGLPGPDLESVLSCENKYWSRLVQREALPDMTPNFARVDPFQDDPLQDVDLDYPFWIKPIKAWRSYLGYRVEQPSDFMDHLPEIRRNITRLSEPFRRIMDLSDAPEHIREGGFLIAEEIIGGSQCTVSGYVHGGNVHVYGVVDSISVEGKNTFSRFEYPTLLDEDVLKRIQKATCRLMARTGLEQGPFNVEFYHEPDTGKLWVLEINPRISQSHAELYRLVDGRPNHGVMVELSLGRKPEHPHGQGPFPRAAKVLIKRFCDGTVEAIPSDADIQRAREIAPEAIIKIKAPPGQRLSEMPFQDPESFELGYVILGGESREDVVRKFEAVSERLPFTFKE